MRPQDYSPLTLDEFRSQMQLFNAGDRFFLIIQHGWGFVAHTMEGQLAKSTDPSVLKFEITDTHSFAIVLKEATIESANVHRGNRLFNIYKITRHGLCVFISTSPATIPI
jgi:hypothetical protein